MAVMNVNPTMMELNKLKRRLRTAQKGHRLLSDKQNELVRQFIILAKDTKKLRLKTEINCLKLKNMAMSTKHMMKENTFNSALLSPSVIKNITVGEKKLMTIPLPMFSVSQEKNKYIYSYKDTPFLFDKCLNLAETVGADLILLAEKEQAVLKISEEITAIRRRVNALEHILIPNIADTVKYIQSSLENNELSAKTRIMKAKELIIQKGM